MTATRYHRPRTIEEAADAVSAGTAAILAGATDIYPASVGRRLHTDVVDLTRVESLRGIERNDDGWRIGACTTWTDIATASLPSQFAALQAAAGKIGGVQVQNRGTIGGNVCTASPAGDSIPVLLTLSAEVEVASQAGRRRLPLDAFLTGYRQNALGPDEFLVAIHVPDRPGPSDFQKLGARSHLVISIAMVASHIEAVSGAIRVAVGACSPVAVRLRGLEAALAQDPRVSIEGYEYPELSPIDDVRGSADYRRRVVAGLVTRSIAACREQL